MVGFLRYDSKTSEKGPSRRYVRRQGSIAVIAAGGIIAFLTFCALSVDLGRAASTRNKLQRACDAGALAGAQLLPENPAAARIEAAKVARINGAPNEAEIREQITIYGNNTTIRVPANEIIGYGFAAVFNMRSANVIGAAVARVEAGLPSVGEGDLVPIAITPETYMANRAGTEFKITRQRQNKGSLDYLEFITVNLDKNGKSVRSTQDQITLGWDEEVKFGDKVTSNNGSGGITNALERGIEDRIERAQNGTWKDFGQYSDPPGDSPRVITLILTPPTSEANVGTYMAPVKGFVKVYIKAYNSTTEEMTVRVLPAISSNSDSTLGDPGTTGVRTIRLID
ncbi:MAG TPA: Tad domain-containing protein [Abditibacteriaceae bacterium]|jgi:hypothetical protein